MIAIVTNDVHDLFTSDWRDIVGTYRRKTKPARGSTQQLSAVHDVVERCYREHGIDHATLVYGHANMFRQKQSDGNWRLT